MFPLWPFRGGIVPIMMTLNLQPRNSITVDWTGLRKFGSNMKPVEGCVAILAFSTVALLGTTGCANTPSVQNESAAQVTNQSSVERDAFKRQERVFSPDYPIRTVFGDHTLMFDCQLAAVSSLDTPNDITYILITNSKRMEGWAFWNTLYDANGLQFSANRVSADVDQLHYLVETMNVILTREYLQKLVTTGGTFRLDGERDKFQFYLPPNLISGFLSAVDRTH